MLACACAVSIAAMDQSLVALVHRNLMDVTALAACTVRASNRAFELGARVTSLQPSPMGERIYRRLGYEELYAYRVMGAAPSS